MPDNLYPSIDPKQITINRDTRQRKENISDIEDLKQSIRAVGIINPITVRNVGETIVLVAGERRLLASLALGLSEVPIRYFDSLTPTEAEVIELEENIKRKELHWKDQVKAVARIHKLYQKKDSKWRIEQTAEALNFSPSNGTVWVRKILHVAEVIDTGRVQNAESIEQAYNTIHRFSERKAESIVGDIITRGATIFGNVNGTTASISDSFTTVSAIAVAAEETEETKQEAEEDTRKESTETIQLLGLATSNIVVSEPIICANFLEWIKTYNGPKFTLIHCDFPYGNYRGGDSKGAQSALDTEDFYDNNESIYLTLLDALTADLDKIMSYSAHMLFWFNFNFYTETVAKLRKSGLFVHDHPLIWHKTGGPGGLGVVLGTAVTYPRRTYDTALLCVRGNRPLAKPGMNSYAAPTAGNKIHPSQKPEPMLRFFLSMLVDETTTMLDPTCGSGAALRAAEDLGAKSILGLELDKNYAETANTKTLQARVMRQACSLRREEVA